MRGFLIATHGLFDAEAGRTLANAPVDQIVVTNTVAPRPDLSAEFAGRLVTIDVARVFAAAIRCCHDGGSINALLGRVPPL